MTTETDTPTAKHAPLKTLDPAPAVSGRSVEITDEDESLFIAFLPVDARRPA